MRAVVVDPTIRQRRGRARQPIATVEIRDIPAPVPPAPGWTIVRPILSGICVSDLALLQGRTTPTPLAAYGPPVPVIPGHEIVGVVESTHRTQHAREGVRVIVEPHFRCRDKGLPECARCRAGEWQLCENRDRRGPVCNGHGIGTHIDAGGGWSEAFAVHEEMLLPAGSIPDHRAVLAEPLSTAIHSALRWERRGERVAVVGSGTTSRLLVATLARLYPELDITVIYDSRRDDRPSGRLGRARREVATRLMLDFNAVTAAYAEIGAARVWRADREALLQCAADQLGARMLRAGGAELPVLDRGFDAVFDCRTTEASVDLSLRLLRGGGTLVMTGQPGRQSVDWSLVWDRELTISAAHSYRAHEGGRRTFAIACEWLGDAGFPIDGLVTHRFPLEDVEQALTTARAGAAMGAVKVVLQGGTAPIPTRVLEEERVDDFDSPILGAISSRVRSEEPAEV